MTAPTDYIFTIPLQDHGYLAQLQEWANHYGLKLGWHDDILQKNGITTVTSYPTIQGLEYCDFKGVGPTLRKARGNAAEIIITSPGTLDTAKSLQPPATIYPVARL